MSNTGKIMKWSRKFNPKHLTAGTQVQLRNGTFTKIISIDEDGPITQGLFGGCDKSHRANGEHFFGDSKYDIVSVCKAAKDKTLDLRKAVVGSLVVFSTGEKAVVTKVEIDGSETTRLSLSNPQLCDGWYFNHSGEYLGETNRQHIVKLKPTNKDYE